MKAWATSLHEVGRDEDEKAKKVKALKLRRCLEPSCVEQCDVSGKRTELRSKLLQGLWNKLDRMSNPRSPFHQECPVRVLILTVSSRAFHGFFTACSRSVAAFSPTGFGLGFVGEVLGPREPMSSGPTAAQKSRRPNMEALGPAARAPHQRRQRASRALHEQQG